MHLDAAIYGRIYLLPPVKVVSVFLVDPAHGPPLGLRAMAIYVDTTVSFLC